ncbi:hypothetical protein MtrunA17_Chr1g0183141 [Medicago truncatula]|uniref:Uncharacterized protein n=1 Tax=Medicago truncatula TaxID=3880 RepID=A0A396JUQ2_MEDTR|nr:hypothetical protein MtrunA17_Chr1g0183141 [Medicago truncatula]
MPIILDAPAAFAPSATSSPTVPRPKTATIDPASTFAVFQTAPRPETLLKIIVVSKSTNVVY